MTEARKSTRYTKSGDNQLRERDAIRYVLETEGRFQKPDNATKRRILELLNLPKGGEWTYQTFDLVLVARGTPPLTSENVDGHIEDLYLVEVKATRKAIRNVALNGFFFGTTARQYELAKAAGGRYRYAFVVLSSDNDYGRPFYVLLTLDDVEARTQSKRLQYQVSFKRDAPVPSGVEPSAIPPELLRQAKAVETTDAS